MKIHPVGATLFHADKKTHGQSGHSQQMLFEILQMRLKPDNCTRM